MKLVSLALLSLLTSTLCFAKSIPIEDFFKKDSYRGVQISPDGKHYGVLIEKNNRVVLLFVNRATGKPVGGVKPENNDILHSFKWVSDDRVTYEFAEKRFNLDKPVATGELFATNVDNSKSLILSGYRLSEKSGSTRVAKKRKKSYSSVEIISTLEGDKKHVLIAEYPWEKKGNYYYDTRARNPIIHRLNIYTGKKRKIETIPFPGARVLATPKGLINFVYWSDEDAIYSGAYRLNAKSPWKSTDDVFGIPSAEPIAINKSGDKVFFRTPAGDKQLFSILETDLQTLKSRNVFENSTADIQNWFLDIDTEIPTVGVSYPGKARYHYANQGSRIETWHKMLASAFKGHEITISNWTKDGKTLIVYVSSDTNPGEYFEFDTTSKQVKSIYAKYRWLDPQDLQAMKPIEVKSRDGLVLPAYLTLPKQKKPPLIILPHGGPHARDYWRYDREVQFFANRGYAVLQVNFRGSTGFGRVYKEMGYRQWGGKLIEDIIDAGKSIIDKGLVNGNKVCIYGGSYGGYAAMVAAAKAPEMFRCAVGYVGVYDLELIYKTGDVAHVVWGGKASIERTLGSDAQELKAFSPVNMADKIKANVMLVHGEQDQRAPIEHAHAMRKAFKKAGKTIEWLEFDKAGHGIWDTNDEIEFYTQLLKFFDTHLK